MLLDRHKARVFDLRLDEVKEQEGLFRPLPRRGRGDGFAGYDGGHAERSVQDEALHHFKFVAEHLREALEKDLFDNLIFGCQESNWHDLESHLHPYLKKRMLGRFSADVGSMKTEQVREQAGRILRESRDERRRSLVKEVLDQAKRSIEALLACAAYCVLWSLGSPDFLMGENYRAHAVDAPVVAIWTRTWCAIVPLVAAARGAGRRLRCHHSRYDPPRYRVVLRRWGSGIR